MTKLTWLGHASWLIETNTGKLLLDPFFADNPAASMTAADFSDVTHVLVSHGHFDHVADVADVLQASGAQLVANFEVAEWFKAKHGVENAVGMNIGGSYDLPGGALQMVPAIHSSSLPDGSYGGTAAGFVLSVGDSRVYFACDTAFFSDMKYYADGVDVAILPIGDLFTMGVADSVAAARLIGAKIVLPTHYNTWPPIEQDAVAWANQIKSETGSNAVVLSVGETYEV